MHVHSKTHMLQQPIAPRPEKPTVARQDALTLPRLSDALSGGGRRGGSSAQDQRERSKLPEQSDSLDAAVTFAARLMALSLATLNGETTPEASGASQLEADDIT